MQETSQDGETKSVEPQLSLLSSIPNQSKPNNPKTLKRKPKEKKIKEKKKRERWVGDHGVTWAVNSIIWGDRLFAYHRLMWSLMHLDSQLVS